MGQSGKAAISAAGLEALMANKDRGGRHSKKVAAKDLKQKRADKRAKRDAGKQGRIISP
jgi:hypothetical protein